MDEPAPDRPKSILIVEDEFLIALDIQAALQELGWQIADAEGALDRALSVARSKPVAAALLDINLGDTDSFGVAAVLQARNVPFAFLTGYERDVVPPEFASAPLLKKPFSREDLARVMRLLIPAG